jgi:hypothetical protein
MEISVIGDYESQNYQDLLQTVAAYKPEEKVLDLSRHKKGDWGKRQLKRANDITESHLVVLAWDWSDHFDCRHDVRWAQDLKKEMMVECAGRYLPFPIAKY